MTGHPIKAAIAIALILCAFAAPARAAEEPSVPSVEAVMRYLGYTAEDEKAFLADEILAKDIERTRDDQLIASVVVYLPIKVDQIAENLRRGLNIQRDHSVMAFGELSEGGGSEQYGQIAYTADEKDELKELIRVKPDDTFNLSSGEIKALREALKGMKARDPAAAEAVSSAYRSVLEGRVRAYLAKGLQGIEPYDHGKKTLSPADELSAVYDQAKPFLSTYFPAFDKALAGFPKDRAPDITSQIYWVKREISDRPGFVLAHQLVDAGPNHVLLSQRQFFVGHTYNSLQVIALVLPHRDGAAVFYVNSAFTDKITGFFSGVAQSVGQSRVKESLTRYFKRIRERYLQ